MKVHEHKWHTFEGKVDILICDCKEVTTLKALLHNIKVDTTRDTTLEVYSKLLSSHELKKVAHDRIYPWVMKQRAEFPQTAEQQGVLF